ncbi:protein of unknown function [Shewanella benthica]|uniref:Uncharacterized protein n=1 Tax=Shewanella benthica TaxID=43661 RepID=A0A330M5P4_9GAMM|nr:protein of unknown function [Shewanella benthica]
MSLDSKQWIPANKHAGKTENKDVRTTVVKHTETTYYSSSRTRSGIQLLFLGSKQ